MKKQKISNELINNAFNFYNKNLSEIFSESETKNLSDKLLNIVEHDYINANENFPYILPQNTLYLIYFIGEYKKAYNHSQKIDKPKNKLESLGEGNYNKKKEFEKGLNHIYDETLDINIRYELYFKNLLLLLLKKPSYKKISLLLLGLFYTQYPFLKPFINEIFEGNDEAIKAINSMEYALDYFEYTHLSENKILNSALIVIYTVLTQNLNMNEEKAYKSAKYLVNTFIDSNNDFPVDSFRQSHITNLDIYYAGIYNGMPIFQWYKNEKQKYFKQKDKQKLKIILKLFLKGLDNDNTDEDINIETMSQAEEMILQALHNLTNDKEIDILINSVHTQFAKLPFPLLQYFPQLNITIASK